MQDQTEITRTRAKKENQPPPQALKEETEFQKMEEEGWLDKIKTVNHII